MDKLRSSFKAVCCLDEVWVGCTTSVTTHIGNMVDTFFFGFVHNQEHTMSFIKVFSVFWSYTQAQVHNSAKTQKSSLLHNYTSIVKLI